MKRIILITALTIVVCLSSYARKFIAEGQTFSAFGNYRIELADDFVTINGVQTKPYVITFENTKLETRVVVAMEKKCIKYYVLTDNLSVQYVSTRNYFGVEKLDKELEKDGYKTSDTDLNRVAYFRQKAITGGEEWKQDKTPLIAACFPQLLNNPENFLAVK